MFEIGKSGVATQDMRNLHKEVDLANMLARADPKLL
jgi:hypothetical protein